MPRFCIALFAAALLCVPAGALGQKMTEQFIPIGQSPGLSGRATDIAEIALVDAAARSLTLGAAAEGRVVQVTEKTWIWLHGSAAGGAARAGGFGDLQPGRRVEVKYQNDERRVFAEWIKVEE